MSVRPTAAALAALQSTPARVRNVCVLAHVDHGKTSLTDGLLAANGIVGARQAGAVRYLDSTAEEQARGITMKASAIALAWAPAAAPGELPPPAPYLINLIDCPGHVDFSSDVTCAARLCDGALVLVDAVEGVCIQTRAVLKAAWGEGLRPTLVLNKVDRLVLELRLTPAEAYVHLCRILESANALVSELYAADLMLAMEQKQQQLLLLQQQHATEVHGGGGEDAAGAGGASFDAWAIDPDARAEAAMFFDPARGNVVFASALDGWACSLDDFAALAQPRLPDIPRAALRRALWGDFTLAAGADGARRVAPAGAGDKPLAVSLFLDRLWALYEAALVTPDDARLAKIVAALPAAAAAAISRRDLAAKDGRTRLQAVARAWLPLHEAVLGMVVRKVPSPVQAQARRVARLWPEVAVAAAPTLAPLREGMALADRLARVRRGIETCDTSEDADVVVFVSKMFAVPLASLPEAASAAASAGGAAALAPTPVSAWWGVGDAPPAVASLAPLGDGAGDGDSGGSGGGGAETLVAFARVFSGVLRPDAPVFVLGPRYVPGEADGGGRATCSHLSQLGAARGDGGMQLLLLMGRELAPIARAVAGSVVGVHGLSRHVLKTATLASTPACASLAPMAFHSTPLVCVAVEPRLPRDLRALERGLALLNQADPCVAVSVAPGGEMRLAALGELHLERCVNDLETRFARVPLNVSPPIEAFMETVSAPPLPAPAVEAPGAADGREDGDDGAGAGGAVEPDAAAGGASSISFFPVARSAALPASGVALHAPSATVVAHTPDRLLRLRLRALPLPAAVTRLLQAQPRALAGLSAAAEAALLRPPAAAPPALLPALAAFAAAWRRAWTEACASDAAAAPFFAQAAFAAAQPPTPAGADADAGAGADTDAGVAAALFDGLLAVGPRDDGPNMLAVRPQARRALAAQLGLLSAAPPADDGAAGGAAALLPSLWQLLGLGEVIVGESSSPPPPPAAALPSQLTATLAALRSSLVQGFRMAAEAGPLCGEPLWGVCFVVEEVELRGGMAAPAPAPAALPAPFSPGAAMSTMRDACRVAVLAGAPRLVEAFYSCQLTCAAGRGAGSSGEQLGRLYAVLARRRARVLGEDMWEGTSTFVIAALLPVAESFGFADDLRKRTSGAATSPQLLFSHWEPLSQDPFYAPTTDEERERLGDRVHDGQGHNLAKRYVDVVRARKGLRSDKKAVERAEAQRTRKRQ